jgi:hypothetical protein
LIFWVHFKFPLLNIFRCLPAFSAFSYNFKNSRVSAIRFVSSKSVRSSFWKMICAGTSAPINYWASTTVII